MEMNAEAPLTGSFDPRLARAFFVCFRSVQGGGGLKDVKLSRVAVAAAIAGMVMIVCGVMQWNGWL